MHKNTQRYREQADDCQRGGDYGWRQNAELLPKYGHTIRNITKHKSCVELIKIE